MILFTENKESENVGTNERKFYDSSEPEPKSVKPKKWKCEELRNQTFSETSKLFQTDVEEGWAKECSQEGCVYREDEGGDEAGSQV